MMPLPVASLTPFGLPFDSAVVLGVLLVLLALALGQRADRDPHDRPDGRTDDQQGER